MVRYQLEQHQRNQEIDKVTQYLSIPERAGFIAGVEWADQHPRKGLWDSEKVIEWIALHAELYSGFNQGKLNSMCEDLHKAMNGGLNYDR